MVATTAQITLRKDSPYTTVCLTQYRLSIAKKVSAGESLESTFAVLEKWTSFEGFHACTCTQSKVNPRHCNQQRHSHSS
jgi:hypothetical protein